MGGTTQGLEAIQTRDEKGEMQGGGHVDGTVWG
jgi:hypothetical protein